MRYERAFSRCIVRQHTSDYTRGSTVHLEAMDIAARGIYTTGKTAQNVRLTVPADQYSESTPA
jgi:hypothetical protein